MSVPYPSTPAQQQKVVDNIKNLKESAIPKNDIVALGRLMESLGIVTTGHVQFPPQGAHGPGSRHYTHDALDLNITPKGINEADTSWADEAFVLLANKLKRAGYNVIYDEPRGTRGGPHVDHMHVSSGPPEGRRWRRASSATASNGPSSSPNPEEPATEEAATSREVKFTAFSPNAEANVLNGYRSYTYNVALGVLPQTATIAEITDTQYLERYLNRYHILDTSGKSGKGDQESAGLFSESILSDGTNKAKVDSVIAGFNRSSPGRFDFFVDDIEIKALGSAGDVQIGPTNTTNLTFNVFEPYSINGFMEAMEVACLAAGYPTYNNSRFVLKIWFTGYPDGNDDALPNPEVIPKSTRYYDILINGITATVGESGTKYQVTAIPYGDLAQGSPTQTFGSMSVKGNTVYRILRHYFEQLNNFSRDERAKLAGDSAAKDIYDRYEIFCPAPLQVGQTRTPDYGLMFTPIEIPAGSDRPNNISNNGPTDPTAEHADIVRANMPNPNSSRATASTGNVSTTNEQYRGQTSLSGGPAVAENTRPDNVFEFSIQAGKPISQAITEIILASDYISKNVIQTQVPEAQKPNANPMLNFFKIRTEIELSGTDPVLHRPSRLYKFIIEPYAVHVTRAPLANQGIIDYDPLMKDIKKEYNYLYTGKNVDLLKFELKLNNMFFSALPPAMGNDAESVGLKQNTAPQNTLSAQASNSATAEAAATDNPRVGNESPSQNTAPIYQIPTIREILNMEDPYTKLAQVMYENILSISESGLKQLEVEILGDPYFISGNRYLGLINPQETADGTLPIYSRETYINFLFRSPIDIHSPTSNGLAVFNDKILPFSGIYQVTEIINLFKGGVFTQRLSCLRLEGQVIRPRQTVTPSSIVTSRSAVPGAQVRQDTADPTVNRTGIRDDGIKLANLFNRGVPSSGLPGRPSDFTSSFGETRAVLQRTSGVSANFANNLGPQPAINLEAGINISPSSLQSFANDAQAAAVGIAGQVMNQVGNIQDAARNLATEMINQLPAISESLAQNVDELEENFAASVSNAEGKIQALQNTITTDPTGIAAKIGIDPSKISGLSSQLASKVTEELNKVADLVPPNANLAGLERAGVVFANMAGTQLANLPPLQPASTAPRPIFDPARVAVTDEFGNVIPILNGQANLAALTEKNKVRNALGQVSAGFSDRFGSAAQVMLNKVGTVQLSVNDISAFSFGVPNPVGSMNQNAIANPSPASVGLGSVESNSGRVDALVQATANVRNSQVNLTLAVQVGSRQTISPLTNLVNNSNSRGTIV